MTKDDFLKLSPIEQDDFILSGGKILSDSGDSSGQQVLISPVATVESQPVEQTGGSLAGSSLPTDSSSGQSVPSPYTEGFDIKDPVELLFLLDDDIASGHYTLHPWQVKFMMDFADERHTKDEAFKAIVRACNGSGKDKYIVAACVVWLCMRFSMARGVVTNGSGVQLDNQTEMYIRYLCERTNSKFNTTIWKTNYRYYECLPTRSPITLFATDEPNKAEGYHPLKPGGKMAIFASEAKAIPDEIFTALNRCTGFTHRVDVSTPGLPMGVFFNRHSTAIGRKDLSDIKLCPPDECVEYHVTAYDCSHITAKEIETMAKEMPGGRTGAAFKSAVLAEFGTTDEMVVIPTTYVWQAYNNVASRTWIQEPHNKGGLDLSDGGDETVLTVRNGNKHLKTIAFRFDNTEDTIEYLNEQFKDNGLTHPEAYVYADCGGLGKPMLDRLKRQGWSNIRYVDNRNTPYYPKTYKNRGSEVWFHFRQLLEHREIIIQKDDKLIRQLSTRYYKITTDNKHQLLSKIESRSRGYPSPDRADSMVLAFWDYKSRFKDNTLPVAEKFETFKIATPTKPVSDFTIQRYAKGDESTPKSRLGKQKDFSVYRELIERHNENIRLTNKQKESEKVTI